MRYFNTTAFLLFLAAISLFLASCKKPLEPGPCGEMVFADTTSVLLGNGFEVCYVQGLVYQLFPPGFSDTSNSFNWSDGSTDPILYTRVPGNYAVTVSSQNGNQNSYSGYLNSDCTTVYLPTAFTPHQNGINDTWAPVYDDVCSGTLVIFTSDGDIVYETNEPLLGWDGKKGDVVLPSGQYFFDLRLRLISEITINQVGSIQLVY